MKNCINPYLFRREYYFSTKETLEYITGQTYNLFDKDIITTFINAIQETPYSVKATNLPFINDDLFKELLMNFFARYTNHAVCVSKYETLDSKVVFNFIIRLLNKVNLTWNYYSDLLSVYRANIDKLMEDVKATSKTKSKFNDTPQLEGADTYEGDDYATNITIGEGETSTPLTTKMMRIQEIQTHYKRVMSDWVDELERVVIEEDIEEEE